MYQTKPKKTKTKKTVDCSTNQQFESNIQIQIEQSILKHKILTNKQNKTKKNNQNPMKMLNEKLLLAARK